MKGKAILFITALVVIGLTLIVYNLAINEWTTNLQLSAAVVCVAELAIFCTMGLLPVINFKNGSTGIMVNIYAGLMILWSLIGCNFEGNVYPIGLLIISALMFVFIGMSVMGSHESDRLNDEIESAIQRKQSYTTSPTTIAVTPQSTEQANGRESLSSIWLTMQSSIDDSDTRKRAKTLIERIQAMPANAFPNATIEGGIKELAAMSRALANIDDQERMLSRMNNKIKELSNYIKSI